MMAFDFPASPTVGQEFVSPGGPIYVWNGNAWTLKPSGTSGLTFISDTPPGSPANGQLWWESDTGTLWISYNDGNSVQWVAVAGGDTTNKVKVFGVPTANQMATWTDASTIQGVNALPGMRVLIQTQTVGAAVASVNFTTGIDATYDEYVFEFYNVKPVVDNQNIGFQLSFDGGATWKSDANYAYGVQYVGYGSTPGTGQTLVSNAIYVNTPQMSAANIVPLNGTARLWLPGASTYHGIMFSTIGHNSTFGLTYMAGSGTYIGAGATGPFNGIRMIANSGNLAQGTFNLYGIKK